MPELANGGWRTAAVEACRMHAPFERVTPAVDAAHDLIRHGVMPGGIALDATAGRGQDTLFLARLLGPEGRVHACDVQEEALERTRRRWASADGPKAPLTLHHMGHEQVVDALVSAGVDRLQAVMFNLGYLPGGNRQLITKPESTMAALTTLLPLIAPGGTLTVVAYPGHPGGREEFHAVVHWARQVPADQGHTLLWQSLDLNDDSPRLIAMRIAEAPAGARGGWMRPLEEPSAVRGLLSNVGRWPSGVPQS